MRRALTKRRLAIALIVVAVLAVWPWARARYFRPKTARPGADVFAQAARVRILRDTYGVPHVFGQSDADAAFGLAYAHAEDDFATLQGVLAAARGQLGLLQISKTALANDYYVHLIGVNEQVDAQYDSLPDDVRALLEGYARGLNLYAYLHPNESDGRIFPMRGRDIAAGFIHKLPLMLGISKVLSALGEDEARHVGDAVVADADRVNDAFPGSNAHAVLGTRMTDGITRLNVNSHQPWEGPVAWYEIQVASNEGWNMTGGTFPGAPFVLVGHNDNLGWGHTVNAPDLIDVYELTRVGERGYRFDGETRSLEVSDAPLLLDLGYFTITLHKEVLRSVQGPVMETKNGLYAVRFAGIGRGIRAVEQWFRMNKARTLDEWKSAMAIQGVPMFNTAYADKKNVYYVYNALLPKRVPGFDYTAVLPGDRGDVVFQDYLPFDALPQLVNPPAGFVETCNATPFQATAGAGNPPDVYPANLGIEHGLTNRARRSLSLLGKPGFPLLSPEDFVTMKFDRAYDSRSPIFTRIIAPLLATFTPVTDAERRALDLLRAWDGVTNEDSPAAALAILTYKSVDPEMHNDGDPILPNPADAFRDSIRWLLDYYGRIDAPLGDVQRLRRGSVDLPLGGGPDVMNASYTRREGGHLVGTQGDSYILLVDFAEDGPHSRSINVYGASSRKASAHYADQAPLFVRRELKPAWRTESEIRAHLEREYHPGE